jgi:hypothetical protein
MPPAGNVIEFHLPRLRTTGMTWAITVFSFVGLLTAILTATGRHRNGLPVSALFGFFITILLFVSGISGVLIWQLSRLISTWQESVRQAAQKAQGELQAQTQAALPPQTSQPITASTTPERPPGMTEHTTRSFKASLYFGSGAQE